MSLQDFLASKAEEPQKVVKGIPTKGYSTLVENATSLPLDLSRMPLPLRSRLDFLAARVLDPDINKTIVVGQRFSGKTFLIEQLAFNLHNYIQRSPKAPLHFIPFNDMKMLELGNTENLRLYMEGIKRSLQTSENFICIVTESLEAALYISGVFPKIRIILELNLDTFQKLILPVSRSGNNIWASWQVADVSETPLTKRQLSTLLFNTLVKRLNPTTLHPLTQGQVTTFINFYLKHFPELEDVEGDEKVVIASAGLWATALRYFMGTLSYTTDPQYLTAEGAPLFKAILNKSFDETQAFFTDYIEGSIRELPTQQIPEEMLRIFAQEGHRIIMIGGASGVEGTNDDEESPVVFKDIKKLSSRLKNGLMGQDSAIEQVADSMMVSAVGLNDGKKPRHSFLFLGPTGVGKTQLAIDLAQELTEVPLDVIRLDMSGYQQEHEVAKLIGAPPGYAGFETGGHLTSAVAAKPNSIVIFDEVEKAHFKVWDAFLQILDYGKLTDGQGNIVDFTKTVIIMTSNIGVAEVNKKTLGFVTLPEGEAYTQRNKDTTETVLKAVRATFRPEFVNRIDDIVIFNELPREVITQILGKEIRLFNEKLEQKGHSLTTPNNAVLDVLLAKSDISKYGARELQRVVFKNVKTPIASFIVENPTAKKLSLTVSNNEITVTSQRNERGNHV